MILEVKNVSYYYKSQRDKLILDHVSYGFECGKLYAILGPSGSGKTTYAKQKEKEGGVSQEKEQ